MIIFYKQLINKPTACHIIKRNSSTTTTAIINSFKAIDRLDQRKNLIGFSFEELSAELATLPNTKSYNTNQIWQYLYRQGYTTFGSMTTLSKPLRETLEKNYKISYGDIQLEKIAKDQTKKYLIGFDTKQDPGAIVESVLIPEPQRSSLCVSSQIGCSLQCSFCHTGTQKLLRNLKPGEVVGQYMIAASRAGDFPLNKNERRTVSNIIFMGQGEPLYNYRNTSKSIKILTHSEGLNFPKSKIVVSTSGVAPLIPKLASELGVSLAVSLHATKNDLRNELVPLNKTYPIEVVLDSCKQYSQLMGKKGRRITFEYVMLHKVNDSLQEAHLLVKLLKQLPSHINLIPFNPWPGSKYTTSNWDQIEKFSQIIMNNGIPCTIRRPRGKDILAACGQLKSSEQNKNNLNVY
ncbi:putative Fe-S containing enzyme [Cunninghamella echinulata]|nr:putative Fe-S containing enzyme [Cunninghamella echinulata]